MPLASITRLDLPDNGRKMSDRSELGHIMSERSFRCQAQPGVRVRQRRAARVRFRLPDPGAVTPCLHCSRYGRRPGSGARVPVPTRPSTAHERLLRSYSGSARRAFNWALDEVTGNLATHAAE